MKIMNSRCKEDTWRPKLSWPDATSVQWGRSGIVFTDTDSYTTAFFEAFGAHPLYRFIRGEGKTLDEAEEDAFKRLEKTNACPGHVWGRKNYTNGLGFCKKCGSTNHSAFRPIFEIGSINRLLSGSDISLINMSYTLSDWDCKTSTMKDLEERMHYRNVLRLRAKKSGLILPVLRHPEYISDDEAEAINSQIEKTVENWIASILDKDPSEYIHDFAQERENKSVMERVFVGIELRYVLHDAVKNNNISSAKVHPKWIERIPEAFTIR